jgi:methionine-rich copper-binding protein CopC
MLGWTRLFKIASLIALPAALLLIWSTVVMGHARYERSEPADGAVMPQSPPRVDVYFTQEVRRSGGLPTLLVVNDTGDAIQTQVVLDDANRTHMYALLAPSLPPGRYTVIWHTLSDEDGEEARGAFHFFVGGGPTTGQTPSPPATGLPSSPSASAIPSGSVPPIVGAAEHDAGASSGTVVALVVGSAFGGLVVGGGTAWALARRK